ncbi:hypothetical protein FB451DRAFT_1448924 [Mycena latifolia]|nr:hypothetical protein FB451DRAFT_1448924 [Mycena latifolia]
MAPMPFALLPADYCAAPATTRGCIDALDLQIAALKSAIRRIKLKRQALKNNLDGYIYPVLTLPNEIISEIFVQYLYQSHSIGTGKSPFFLGHICRAWREVALDTPFLWTDIEVRIENVAARERQLERLTTLLSRSGDCPLFIGVLIFDGSAREFITALAPHFRRCECLTLVAPFHDVLLIKSDFPIIRNLSIGISELHKNAYHADEPSWPVKVFHAPKLRDVSITVFTYKLVLPWAQITSISFRWVHHLPDLLDILCAARNVATLSTEIIHASPTEVIAKIPAIPPLIHLHTLELTVGSSALGCAQLLDKLTLPALRDLRIPEACFIETPTAVRGFVARSGCSLPALCLTIADAAFSWSYYRRAWPRVGEVIVEHPESESESEDDDSGIWDSENERASNTGSDSEDGSEESE